MIPFSRSCRHGLGIDLTFVAYFEIFFFYYQKEKTKGGKWTGRCLLGKPSSFSCVHKSGKKVPVLVGPRRSRFNR